MGRKKKSEIMPIDKVPILQQAYVDELDKNPEFALTADPEGKYKMSDLQKKFIEYYVNFKSVATAAELAGINMDEARELFVAYNSQLEIRRINRALYHRQFSSKLLTIDDIAGYLSSLLTGENVPLADQLKSTEKLRVVELILRLNELKANSMNNPNELNKTDIAIQIKNLSLTTIQQLLTQSNSLNIKNNAIAELDNGQLTIEEKAYLQSLPVNDLLQLIDNANTKGGLNDNKN